MVLFSNINTIYLPLKCITYRPFCDITASQGQQKEIRMETLNSNPEQKESAPAPAAAPEAAAAPVMSAATITNATPAVTKAPAAAPAPATAPVVKGELPKTDGKTPGGWNRFAGYDPKAAKNKANDRGGKGRR
jgi:hypothetical protein